MEETSKTKSITAIVPFYQSAFFYYFLAFIIVIIGFWSSFFTQLGSTKFGHLIHGISATLWMLVPVVQAWLIRHERHSLHRTIGKISLLLVPIVFFSGLYVVRFMVLREPILTQLGAKFVLLDVGSMIFFVSAIALAIKNIYKWNIELHSQWMTCSMLIVLEPAIERVFAYLILGNNNFEMALTLAMITVEIIVAVVILIDWYGTNQFSRPYLILFAFLLILHFLIETLGKMSSFSSFVRWCLDF